MRTWTHLQFLLARADPVFLAAAKAAPTQQRLEATVGPSAKEILEISGSLIATGSADTETHVTETETGIVARATAIVILKEAETIDGSGSEATDTETAAIKIVNVAKTAPPREGGWTILQNVSKTPSEK